MVGALVGSQEEWRTVYRWWQGAQRGKTRHRHTHKVFDGMDALSVQRRQDRFHLSSVLQSSLEAHVWMGDTGEYSVTKSCVVALWALMMAGLNRQNSQKTHSLTLSPSSCHGSPY